MDRGADLRVALEFVIRRIEEQAMRSGEPLNHEQRLLLNDLPESSPVPQIVVGDPESPAILVPRDMNYERLCAAAKAAYRSDLELNPASLDWQFAFDVLRLNRHPLNWLLQWPGVKQQKPWWDGWLLVAAALFFVVCTMTFMFPVIKGGDDARHWILFGVAYVALVVLMYFVSRSLEQWQLRRHIEKCRRASRFVAAK